jgi:DNA-binding winged helix-turn-helix (wHTH) protein
MAARAHDGSWVIHFSVFEVDLRAGELRRNGLKVKLQEQPFQILAMLLERPGEFVIREELRARLWSADTFVDFDHGLNSAIRRLQEALGDSAETPGFVETLGRRGYRFIAPWLHEYSWNTPMNPLNRWPYFPSPMTVPTPTQNT